MRVCLVTTGQPSTNPRLVKEADALVAAGFQVHVVAAHWADWASATDEQLLASKAWTMTFVDWRKDHDPGLFLRSRIRHWVARSAAGALPTLSGRLAAALSRVGPELRGAAMTVPAELYIAHNLGALPAASAAAHAHSAELGFDAEDFHSGQLSRPVDAREAAFTREIERQFLPRCSYVTAAAPGIARAYRDLCGIPLPATILNVFPLRDRPDEFPPPNPLAPVRLYWFSQTIGGDRGLEDVVRAMGLLTPHRVELHLRGRWQPGYEASLRRLAAEANVPQDCIVGYEPAGPDQMVRLASSYDIGLAVERPVSVNNDILLSNKIFTYVLAGSAVLATRTQGQAELIPELGAAAASCEAANPKSMAAALRPWVESRQRLQTARETSWRLGETRFNWDLEQKKFLDVTAAALRLGASDRQALAHGGAFDEVVFRAEPGCAS